MPSILPLALVASLVPSAAGGGDKLPEPVRFGRAAMKSDVPSLHRTSIVFAPDGKKLAWMHYVPDTPDPKNGGLLMIQVWPFYHSEHGSHLWEWFPRGFAQFLHEPEELEATVRANPGPDPEWAEAVLWAYRHLNQITLDDLQRSLQLGGFRTVRVHPMTGALQPPVEVAKLPLSLITIAGVELLATPY